MRHMFTVLLAIALPYSGALGQVDCGSRPDIPADIQQKISGDVEGKAQLFTKLLGDAQLKGKVEASKSELHQKYRDVDKAAIDQYMIWVSCQTIMRDNSLTTTAKIQLWLQLYRELSANPGKSSSLNNDFLSKVRVGAEGKTSIDYIKAKLGTPNFEDGGIATFETGGYIIKAKYVFAAETGWPKGKVMAIKIAIDPSAQDRVAINPALIVRLADPPLDLGSTRLSDRTQDVGCISFQYLGGIEWNSNPVPYCEGGGSHADDFVVTRFYLDAGPSADIIAKKFPACKDCIIDLYYLMRLREAHEGRRSNIERRKYIEKYGKPPAYDEYEERPEGERELYAEMDRDLRIGSLPESDKVARLDELITQVAATLVITGVQYAYSDETTDDQSGR